MHTKTFAGLGDLLTSSVSALLSKDSGTILLTHTLQSQEQYNNSSLQALWILELDFDPFPTGGVRITPKSASVWSLINGFILHDTNPPLRYDQNITLHIIWQPCRNWHSQKVPYICKRFCEPLPPCRCPRWDRRLRPMFLDICSSLSSFVLSFMISCLA